MGKIQLSQNSIKSSIHNAIQYTLLISVMYIIYKFANPDSPSGTEFITYIIPMVLTNIIFVVFPLLLVFFYFKDGNAIDTLKENILHKNGSQTSEIQTRETLREYHSMLKEGIITQEEFESIKKKHLKSLHKD